MRQDYGEFYKTELDFRREMGYPPFSDIFKLTVSSMDETLCAEAASWTADAVKAALGGGASVVGPAQAPVYKLNNKFRLQIIIKTTDIKNVRAHMERILAAFSSAKRYADALLCIEFNPAEC